MTREEIFRAALHESGIEYSGPICIDGKLHRIKANGDHSKNSWYVLYPGPPAAGAYGCWKRHLKKTWCERNGSLTQSEWQNVCQRWREAKAKLAAETVARQKKARKVAAWILNRSRPARTLHRYLFGKRVKVFGNVRQYRRSLVLPLRDSSGELQSLQFIGGDGAKNFLAAGRIAGCFFTLADKAEGPLIVCEGYATGATIHEATGGAVICAMNSGNLLDVAKVARELWPQREIIVAADNDQFTDGNPGLTKATAAAKAIRAQLAVPQFNDIANKPTDFNDLAVAEGLGAVREQVGSAQVPRTIDGEFSPQTGEVTDEETIARLAALSPWEYERVRDSEAKKLKCRVTTLDKLVAAKHQNNGGASQGSGDGKSGRKCAATRLVEFASAFEFFHDPQDRPFVRLEIKGHMEVWPVESTKFRKLLAQMFYKRTRNTINRNALTDAIATLAGRACHDAPEQRVFLRVAPHGENILIDLCDPQWRVIEVTSEGWQILDRSPVAFVHTGSMQALPLPERGGSGSIKPLWDLLNVSEAQRPLVAGALLNYFHPEGPYFVTNYVGEQGSAKSCAARIHRQLVDPNENPLRSPPREERDLIAQAANNWCVAFDNVSSLPLWQSDALCRLATGGGHSARTLYTDLEEISLAVKRPVILNGIEDVATRPDLAERALQIELETIPDGKRTTEKELWQCFDKNRAVIFTAILDALSCALRELPRIKLNSLPRMADAALWATAGESAFGFEQETFIAAYRQNLHEGAVASVKAHPVGQAITKLLEAQEEWSGGMEELLEELIPLCFEETRHQKNWPKNASALGRYLRRLAPAMRKAGLRCEWIRTSEARTITLRKLGKKSSQASFTQKESERVPGHAPSPESPSSSSAPQWNDTNDRKDGNFLPTHSEGSEPSGEPAEAPDQQPALPNGAGIVVDEKGIGEL